MIGKHEMKSVTKFEGPYGRLYDTPEEAALAFAIDAVERLIAPPPIREDYRIQEDVGSFSRRVAKHILTNRKHVIEFLRDLDGPDGP